MKTKKTKREEDAVVLDMRTLDEQHNHQSEQHKDAVLPSASDEGVENRQKKRGISLIKRCAHFIFIDAMSGMTLGLFATLIIGTIIAQAGKYVGDNFVGNLLSLVGAAAKSLMGAGIGVGIACRFKKSPLLTVSAGVAGIIGAHASAMLSTINSLEVALVFSISSKQVGEPVGAFIAALVAVVVGSLVSGKTKIDIIVTPVVAIISGTVAGLITGPPIAEGMAAIGSAITWAMGQNRLIMGLVISVLMGIALTAPISSAALGIMLNLTGLAAGAATVGCCCQMVGFAVASFRENRWGGLFAQGLGTSMLQMPNIMKKPAIWLPPIIASAILGPISSTVLGMTNNAIGSGMGTSGLVGPLMAFETMVAEGMSVGVTVTQIALMYFVLPAVICLFVSELLRKIGLIQKDDMRLRIN